MKVVVLGKGLMLANIILGVIDSGAEIVGVFRYEQTCNSRLKLLLKDFFSPAPEVTLIKKLKLNEIRVKSANSEIFQNLLIRLNPDLIIVGTWQEKISAQTFNIPTIATINVHPSLLPKYRGPNPYMQAILHGEEYSGVTLHLMNENYDSGPILKQKKVLIQDTDTSKDLRSKSVVVARELVSELIKDLNERALMPINQDERYASYFPNISGDEMMLDFTVQSSMEISRTIRALHPFLPTYITYKDKFFIVNPYHFELMEGVTGAPAGAIVSKNPQNASIVIVCADNKAIRFSNLRLYKSKNVKQFIKNEVEVF